MRALPPPPESVDEQAFWRKLRALPMQAVQRALLLYAILTDCDTPAWAKALILSALVYLINPLDLVPDALPGIGLTDDLTVMALALERLSRFVTPQGRERAARLTPRAFSGNPHQTAN